MSATSNPNRPVITSYAEAPVRSVTANGVTFSYRELGPTGGVPVIFFVHLAATLDNWDPRIVDPIAQHHHVIAFDNRGVGASTGKVPDSVEAMADDAYAFITALGFDQVDIFSFSLGGMVAQALVVKHPELVRKMILTGTGPKGGKDMDKVAGPPTTTSSGRPSPAPTRRSTSSSSATRPARRPARPSSSASRNARRTATPR